MKYQVKLKKEYKKSLKLMYKQGKNLDLIDEVVWQLANGNRLAAKYNDHKLWNSKKYKDCRECHIEPDWLLIYKIENDKLILTLTDTGTHSDLF